jgi:hypothetical protein
LTRPRVVIVIAHDADGADGVFESPTYPDDPAPGMAFATEGNVDAQYPKENLCIRRSRPVSARDFSASLSFFSRCHDWHDRRKRAEGLRRDPLDYDVAHAICEQMGLIAWSCNAKAVTVRIRIDFDHNLFDRSARCLAATDRSHSNKASRLQLCKRARKVRLGPPSHLH